MACEYALETPDIVPVGRSLTACSHTEEKVKAADKFDSWDPKAAANYLDQRQITWMGWPSAWRDHDTFRVSCHTAVPYVLSRPVLREALAEPSLSDSEPKLLDNVTKRVRLWNEVGPFCGGEEYDGGKIAESRGTEGILNALIPFKLRPSNRAFERHYPSDILRTCGRCRKQTATERVLRLGEKGLKGFG